MTTKWLEGFNLSVSSCSLFLTWTLFKCSICSISNEVCIYRNNTKNMLSKVKVYILVYWLKPDLKPSQWLVALGLLHILNEKMGSSNGQKRRFHLPCTFKNCISSSFMNQISMIMSNKRARCIWNLKTLFYLQSIGFSSLEW